jgi:hypothetical protein
MLIRPTVFVTGRECIRVGAPPRCSWMRHPVCGRHPQEGSLRQGRTEQPDAAGRRKEADPAWPWPPVRKPSSDGVPDNVRNAPSTGPQTTQRIPVEIQPFSDPHATEYGVAKLAAARRRFPERFGFDNVRPVDGALRTGPENAIAFLLCLASIRLMLRRSMQSIIEFGTNFQAVRASCTNRRSSSM